MSYSPSAVFMSSMIVSGSMKTSLEKKNLVITPVLHQRFEDVILKGSKEIGSIVRVIWLCDRFFSGQLECMPLYLHDVQFLVELLEQLWRLVGTFALEDGNKDVVCSKVMNGFEDAVGPVGYDLFVIEKHSGDKYFLYRSVSESNCVTSNIYLDSHIQSF